jgi:four helix bundle protein
MHDKLTTMEAKENIIQEKSLQFAIRIVKLCKIIRNEKHEYELASQLLRSGTSIGANICESRNAQSKNDFINKLNIALKESDETEYWIKLLYKADILDKRCFDSIHNDCLEIIRLLTSIIKTSKDNY